MVCLGRFLMILFHISSMGGYGLIVSVPDHCPFTYTYESEAILKRKKNDTLF